MLLHILLWKLTVLIEPTTLPRNINDRAWIVRIASYKEQLPGREKSGSRSRKMVIPAPPDPTQSSSKSNGAGPQTDFLGLDTSQLDQRSNRKHSQRKMEKQSLQFTLFQSRLGKPHAHIFSGSDQKPGRIP